MLLRERRLSRSFAGRGGREEEFELRARFVSIGGRGFSEDGRTRPGVAASGRRGNSGAPEFVSSELAKVNEIRPTMQTSTVHGSSSALGCFNSSGGM